MPVLFPVSDPLSLNVRMSSTPGDVIEEGSPLIECENASVVPPCGTVPESPLKG